MIFSGSNEQAGRAGQPSCQVDARCRAEAISACVVVVGSATLIMPDAVDMKY